jgi:ferritin-like metal-binding protein YciE
MDELKNAYLQKLAQALSMEEVIIEHLPDMAAKASNEELRAGLLDHLEETKLQRDRLSQVLASNGAAAMEERDDAFELLAENAGTEIGQVDDPDVRDAVIIAAAQTIEHIEMARYATLIAWARQMGDGENVLLLEDTLAEEQAADRKLSGIAEGGIFMTGTNESAANDDY